MTTHPKRPIPSIAAAFLILAALLSCQSGSSAQPPPAAVELPEEPSRADDPPDTEDPLGEEGTPVEEQVVPPRSSSAPKASSPRNDTRTLPDPTRRYRVKWVYDGDSIEVWIAEGQHLGVRYLGVDTPEHGEPMSEEAKRANLDLVKKKDIRIVTDPATDRHFDKYGRVLGYIFVLDQDGQEVMVNERLLRGGYASYYPYGDPLREQARFQAAQDAARADRAGIWSLPHEPAPHYIGAKRRFHRPDCKGAKYAKDPKRFETRDAALDAHLSPCRECKP